MLAERMSSTPAKIVSCLLLITMTNLFMSRAWAQTNFEKRVEEANAYSATLYENMPSISDSVSEDGDITYNGEVYFTRQQATGQQDDDYVPADTSDSYGNDANTIMAGEAAQSTYSAKDPENSGEIAYSILSISNSTEKPDLTNDPIFDNTDSIIENLSDIASGFAECHLDTSLVSNGESYHVPVYKTCDVIPVIEGTYTVGHTYDVGIIKYDSGEVTMSTCGDGCLDVWLGDLTNNGLSGHCTVYEKSTVLELLQPEAMISATLKYVSMDDWYQFLIDGTKVYYGPYANGAFPPEIGDCIGDPGGHSYTPNLDLTSYFTSKEKGDLITLKSRVSVMDHGEGYAKTRILYDPSYTVYNEVWSTDENIEKIKEVQTQLDDGICTGSVVCTSMPTLDANGCATIDGVYVCEDDFEESPIDGISPLCMTVQATSTCGFNEGEICTTDLYGVETCFQNSTVNSNTCEEYEDDPTCSYISTTCLENSTGASGACYTQENKYDCGFDASSGTETEQDTLVCDGEIQCIGESCYSPTQDDSNSSFGEVSAYMEMLKYATSDMTCEDIPAAPYNEENPPDVYYPAMYCENGGTYDATIGECVGDETCSYDDSNYYAVDSSEGTQIVYGDSIAYEDNNTVCSPQEINGVIYSCGESTQKTGSDTFYQVCTQTVYDSAVEGCPDDAHELKDGLCQVPPVVDCPTGYEAVEGADIWSTDDDYCLLEFDESYICNDSNETYNSETGICEGMLYEDAVCSDGTISADGTCTETESEELICPDGYELDGVTCKKTEAVSLTASCDTGYTLVLGADDESIDDDYCLLEFAETYTCDSSYETYNSATGVCEGILSEEAECEDGVDVIDGACPNKIQATPMCNNGYILDNGSCVQTITIDPIYSCSSGSSLNGNECSQDITECRYDSNNYVKIENNECNSEISYIWGGDTYSSGYTKGDYQSILNSGGCRIDHEMVHVKAKRYSICKLYTETSVAIVSCEDGYTESDSTCSKTITEEVTCEDGYSYNLDSGYCEYEYYTSPVCDGGYSYNTSTNTCELSTESDAEVSCDITGGSYNTESGMCEIIQDVEGTCSDGYVVVEGQCQREVEEAATCEAGFTYNTETGSCEYQFTVAATCSNGYALNVSTGECEVTTSSDAEITCNIDGGAYNSATEQCQITEDAGVSCPDAYPSWNDDDQRCETSLLNQATTASTSPLSNNNTTDLLDELLNPFKAVVVGMFPKAYAEETGADSSVMTSYITDQFTAAKEIAETNETVIATNTDGDSGCELFQGTASECKVAIGGMQDCCESPVSVSLGDYIALTEYTMMADAAVANAGLIEGYSGAWNIASDAVADGATYAWDSVSSLWASSGDAATAAVDGAGTASTEAASEGVISGLTQTIMVNTNEFLVNSFGQETASFFFQSTANAAGETVIQASTQMAALGSALMVIYYAYLAYVIFNLLIGIIFACTDEEMDLAMKVELLSTHYIGSYCKTDSIVGCIEKRKSYCQFDSPLSRIMMEQIYDQPQMGLDWGTARNPNCTGLTISNMSDVDWDLVNLDEWIGMLISTDNYTDQSGVNGDGLGLDIDSLTGEGSRLDDLTDTDNQVDRENVLETNQSRFEDYDADEVYQDAYDEGWNQTQTAP